MAANLAVSCRLRRQLSQTICSAICEHIGSAGAGAAAREEGSNLLTAAAAVSALALIRRRRKQSNYISVYPRRRSDNARTGR